MEGTGIKTSPRYVIHTLAGGILMPQCQLRKLLFPEWTAVENVNASCNLPIQSPRGNKSNVSNFTRAPVKYFPLSLFVCLEADRNGWLVKHEKEMRLGGFYLSRKEEI